MGLHDTFEFDEAAYRLKTTERSTLKLQEEEIKKLRQHFTASCSIGAGLGHSVASGGISLGVSAWGARRYHVAKKKLCIIQEELQRRGVPLHDMTKRDAFIPITASLAGMGIGAGVGHILGGLAPAPDLPTGCDASHVLQGQIVAHDPINATHGFVEGIMDQPHAIGQAAHSEIAGALAGHGTDVATTAAGDGHAVGYVAGVAAAKKAEEFLAESAGEIVFGYALEKLLDPEIRVELRRAEKCSRLLGPLGQYCYGCGDGLRRGKFAHCCVGNDDYDLCIKCFTSGKSCACSDRQMLVMQKAVAGDVILSQTGETRRRHATIPHLSCGRCSKSITQGRYYYCPSCNESQGGYDICEVCYAEGQACESPEDHRLHVYLRANVPKMNIGPYAQTSGGCANCSACEKKVHQGPYYHCSECGDFDICEHCYELGRTCKDRDAGHVFDRYHAYLGDGTLPDDHDWKGTCDFCKESLANAENPFYHCLWCDNGKFDLCQRCYMSGACCKDRNHMLMKCAFEKS